MPLSMLGLVDPDTFGFPGVQLVVVPKHVGLVVLLRKARVEQVFP